jgi:hypothetical protein
MDRPRHRIGTHRAVMKELPYEEASEGGLAVSLVLC